MMPTALDIIFPIMVSWIPTAHFCVPAFSLLLQWCRLAGIPLLFLTTLSFDGCFVPFSCHVLSRDDFFFSKLNLAQVFDSFDEPSLAQPSYVPCPRLLAVVSFFNVYGDFAALSFGSLERKSIASALWLGLLKQTTNECSEHPAFVRNNGEGSEVAENGVFKSAGGSDNVCSRATGCD
ncbi:hypothetical protein NC652_014085 [Populus alba x Populus x berolinensis]|nr:hypothetical protein NC652_014085 [Populus alba x Populus x berolinensis]